MTPLSPVTEAYAYGSRIVSRPTKGPVVSDVYSTSRTPWARSSNREDERNPCFICGQPSTTEMPGASLCIAHAVSAARLKLEHDLGLERQGRKRTEREAREAVVYYVTFGDRIKIGTTTNLRQRLADTQYDRLLATEPGGYAVERQRHRQFGHLRVTTRGREWFSASPDLLAFIATLPA